MSKRPQVPEIREIEKCVGARVREGRNSCGLTQQELATLIGVSYQQMHKYECGINRVSAGRLYQLAELLKVPISYFFEGLPEEIHRPRSNSEQMFLEFVRNLMSIKDKRLREALIQLVRVLAEPETLGTAELE